MSSSIFLNGGVIGKINSPNTSIASGIWNLDAQFDAKSNSAWPIITPTSVEALVIAGGGGGYGLGGGGGAGGVRYETSVSVMSGTAYTITVGAGGTGSPTAYYTSVVAATKGSNSVFSTITAEGGGPGGGYPTDNQAALAGGSGGGSAYGYLGGNGVTGQGNKGGDGLYNSGYGVGGGGGGKSAAGAAGLAGQNGFTAPNGEVGGNGGNGQAYTITGSSVTYGGGGGGSPDGRQPNRVNGSGGTGGGGNAQNGNGTTSGNGTDNLGGGGGGNYLGSDLYAGAAGNGGKGVVIIAYPSSFAAPVSIGAGLTYTVSTTDRAGYRVYKFTNGTGTITW